MQRKMLNVLMVSLVSFSIFIVGCSSDNQGLLNPNSKISQEIPNEPKPAENQPPIVKFECISTSVAPGSSLMVRVNVIDPEDDEINFEYSNYSGTIEVEDEGVYRWTLPVQLGIYPLEVTVFDGTNEAKSILFVEVAEQPTFGRIN